MEYWSNGVMEKAKKYNVFEAFLNTPILHRSNTSQGKSIGGWCPPNM